MVKSETRRDAETLVRNPSPRLFAKKFRDSKKVKTNHAKTRLPDLSKMLPRFRDPVKIFRGTIHHPCKRMGREKQKERILGTMWRTLKENRAFLSSHRLPCNHFLIMKLFFKGERYFMIKILGNFLNFVNNNYASKALRKWNWELPQRKSFTDVYIFQAFLTMRSK